MKLALLPYAIGDYPHHLRVIGTDANGAEIVLFDDAAVTATALSAVFEPAAPGVHISWRPRVLSRVRIEQRGVAGDRQWSVFELQVLDGTENAVAGGG